MVEESLPTPMNLEDACSEGGRFGVYCRLLEDKAMQVGFPLEEEPGFKVIFPLLFALVPNFRTNPEVLDKVPLMAIHCHDKGVIVDENDILHEFPNAIFTEEDARLNMALLYIALEFGLARQETSLTHLHYLFSAVDNIRPYVKKGYELSEEAALLEVEVKNDLKNRLPEDLYSALDAVKKQIHALREYCDSHPN